MDMDFWIGSAVFDSCDLKLSTEVVRYSGSSSEAILL